MANQSSEESVLRGLVESWYQALHSSDTEAMTRNYAEDVVFANLAPPLWTQGRENYKGGMRQWFDTFDGPLTGEAEGLSVTVGDELAFVNGLSHITGTKKGGHALDLRQRLTLCFQRRDGQWKVIAEHTSVPFDMQTFQPLIGLKE